MIQLEKRDCMGLGRCFIFVNICVCLSTTDLKVSDVSQMYQTPFFNSNMCISVVCILTGWAKHIQTWIVYKHMPLKSFSGDISRKLVFFMILDPDCGLQKEKKRFNTGKTIKQRAVTCTMDTLNISKSPPFSILLFVIIWSIMMRGVRYDATIDVLVWHLHEPKSNQHLT